MEGFDQNIHSDIEKLNIESDINDPEVTYLSLFEKAEKPDLSKYFEFTVDERNQGNDSNHMFEEREQRNSEDYNAVIMSTIPNGLNNMSKDDKDHRYKKMNTENVRHHKQNSIGYIKDRSITFQARQIDSVNPNEIYSVPVSPLIDNVKKDNVFQIKENLGKIKENFDRSKFHK